MAAPADSPTPHVFAKFRYITRPTCVHPDCTSLVDFRDKKCAQHSYYKHCSLRGCYNPPATWSGLCIAHSRTDPFDGLCQRSGCNESKTGMHSFCRKHEDERCAAEQAKRKMYWYWPS